MNGDGTTEGEEAAGGEERRAPRSGPDGASGDRRGRRGDRAPLALAVALAILFVAGLGIGLLVAGEGGGPGSRGGAGYGDAPDDAGRIQETAEAGPSAGAGGARAGPRPGGGGATRDGGGTFSSLAAPAGLRADTAGPRMTATVRVADRVGRSVVSIVTVRRVRTARSPLDYFFGGPSGTRDVPGLGSGFAIDEEGHVLTNEHVIRDADSLAVIDHRGRRLSAEVVGSDDLTDIALLEVAPGRLEPAPLGSSSDLMVGEPAIAIGNPAGFNLVNTEPTVTTGVVSGVGRDIRSDDQQQTLYADMIQTDAAINPGNSGGPLVSAEGRVIGVNSSIFSRSGGSEGLGFAIPIDRALRIADELRSFGRVRRPWVGVDVASVPTDSLIRQPEVQRVAPDSPGARAGLREGDVLLSVGEQRIRSPLDWEVSLLEAGIGSEVPVRFLREGRERTAALRIEEVPSGRAERVEVLRGLQLVSVTAQIAQERRLEVDQGALIVEIERGISQRTNMRPGDVIVAINNRQVRDAGDAAELFRYHALGGGFVRVTLYRGGAFVWTSFGIR